MPIVRTYACNECGHFMRVTLRMDQSDVPPPDCPRCNAYDLKEPMRQEFKPPAIIGSHRYKATKLAEDIAEKDYNVADMKVEGYEGVRNKVRYKDQRSDSSSSWGINREALEAAAVSGRQMRLQHGSGLDIIKEMPDLIANSKRRSMRVW